MNPAKELLLADVTYAERLRQAEQAQRVQAALRTARGSPASRWWARWIWRPGRRPARLPVHGLVATKA
jgi:hypothetical protein